jgi:hypothetical protein
MTHSLAVVVADADPGSSDATATMAALRRELGPDDQVVWVERGESRTRLDLGAVRVERLAAPSESGRGELYGIGLPRVETTIVAFTDAATVVLPGWRNAVMRAFEPESVGVVGGPVVPPHRLGPAGRAGFLLEYGPHAVAPFRSASGDLTANNIAYRAEVVRSCTDAAVWKTVVNDTLTQRGVELVVVPEMRVEVTDHYDLRWLLGGRTRAGRLYGSHIAPAMGRGARVVRALGRVALPPVMVSRAVRVARREPALRAGLGAAIPVLVLSSVAWSAGEAAGVLTARAPRGGVM